MRLCNAICALAPRLPTHVTKHAGACAVHQPTATRAPRGVAGARRSAIRVRCLLPTGFVARAGFRRRGLRRTYNCLRTRATTSPCAIDHVGVEPAQHLVAAGGGLAQFVQHRGVQVEARVHGAAPGFDEFDLPGLVPDDVVAAERVQRQQHPERIGHREQAAAEMGADVVAVPRAHAQFDARMAVVVG